jgi:phosphoribosylamine--glycine ligase
VLTEDIVTIALRDIVEPTVAEMAKRGTPFQGILYAGLMIKDGQPRLVEYNVRFGDPECQVLMMRLGGQILDLLHACAENRLSDVAPNWADDHAMTVVMAVKGYPGAYEKGSPINNLAALSETSSEMTFHAGTAAKDGQIVAIGGRVLNVTARGATLKDAHAKVYAMVRQIDWPDGFYRTDIGHRAL